MYITPRKKDAQADLYNTLAAYNWQLKVIQVSVDGIKQRVDQGMSFEEATAAVMNHEILHALRGLDLFTAQEYSLLERDFSTIQQAGKALTYGQWAVSTYPNLMQ